MISAIIFDLDGVLIDSREIHFNALNLALSNISMQFVISKDEQSSTYEGLTTRSKLSILTELKGLNPDLHDQIWKDKQIYSSAMFSSVSPDRGLQDIFKIIRRYKIKIAVASNSIRSTLDGCLIALGVEEFIDISLSNEDVVSPKPNPEIYLRCFSHLGVDPEEVVIFEDSPIGLAAAISSGAKVVKVQNRSDLTIDKVLQEITGE